MNHHTPFIQPSRVRDAAFYTTLDPGIRTAVLWLHAFGFETSDSGDGESKFIRNPETSSDDILNVPHVVIPTMNEESKGERWQTARRSAEVLDWMLRRELGEEVFATDEEAARREPMYLPELVMDVTIVPHRFRAPNVPGDHIMLIGRGLLRLAPTVYLVGEERLLAFGEAEARRAVAWLLRDPEIAHTEARNRVVAENLIPVLTADGELVAFAGVPGTMRGPGVLPQAKEIPVTTCLDGAIQDRWLASVTFHDVYRTADE